MAGGLTDANVADFLAEDVGGIVEGVGAKEDSKCICARVYTPIISI